MNLKDLSDAVAAEELSKLRDQFAMAAMQGLLTLGFDPFRQGEFVRKAYSLADAMLAERAKEKQC